MTRWDAAATLIADHRDVLDGRPMEADVPAVLVEREWAAYLLALEDEAVEQLEARGIDAQWPDAAPASLIDFTASVRAVCDVPFATGAVGLGARRFESPRKQQQIDAFARIVVPLATQASRVVDVGSGHGHLTRTLADRLQMPVLGLERDPALADTARALARDGAAAFAVTDVLAAGLALSRGDCVVGLHACGELGDAMVASAASAGAALALVGCCLQKRRPDSRASLFALQRRELDLPKSILGLSNLTARDDAVETSRAENLRARKRRLALHRLLTEAGASLALGAELEGLNRRAAHAELEVLVPRAFALRALESPSRAAIADAARWAHVHHARMRRLALPRSLLGRALEVFVVLDRAAYLESRGYEVSVAILFPAAVSARNLVLSAALP